MELRVLLGGYREVLNENRASCKTLVISIFLVLAILLSIPQNTHPVHAADNTPSIVGWGGSRLMENENFTNPSTPSIVFPGENASDQEVLARAIVHSGANAIRVSFAPYCDNPNGFIGLYNSTRLARAIKIAATLGLWIIVDYHGYNDTFNQPTCWLNFWSRLTSQFKSSYSQIIWEPINEPDVGPWIPSVCSSDTDCLSYISREYQSFINQTRAQGDAHWIVVQNICSFGCELCPDGTNDCSAIASGYPTVNDPLNRVFVSIHPYMSYQSFHATWNYTTAVTLADLYYQAMLVENEKTGLPILDTEGGPGPVSRNVNGTSLQCPDMILPGPAGYCRTNLEFIQTLTALLESHYPQRFNWLWWPTGDWTTTPGSGILGSIAANGWGQQISWQKSPVYNLVLNTSGSGTTFPSAGNYSYTAGTIVNLTADPYPGSFFYWQLDNGQTLTSDMLQVSMISNHVLSVLFTPIIHSIALTQLNVAYTAVLPGTVVPANATVKNQGTVSETFNITLSANGTRIGSTTVTSLPPGRTQSASFNWNTLGRQPGRYIVTATAGPINGTTGSTSSSSTTITLSSPPDKPGFWTNLASTLNAIPGYLLFVVSAAGAAGVALSIIRRTNRRRSPD